ncbi:MAG: hypothetical protein ACI4JA_11560 [Oscillospiraceae bacterium]
MVRKRHLILSIIFILLFAVWYVLGCEFYAGHDDSSAVHIVFFGIADEDISPVLSEKIYAIIIGLMTVVGFVWTIVRFCRKSVKNSKAYAVYMAAWFLTFVGKLFINIPILDIHISYLFEDTSYALFNSGELCYYPALVILGYCTYSALREAFFKERNKA